MEVKKRIKLSVSAILFIYPLFKIKKEKSNICDSGADINFALDYF